MTRYSYKTAYLPQSEIQGYLNKMGEEGFRLVKYVWITSAADRLGNGKMHIAMEKAEIVVTHNRG